VRLRAGRTGLLLTALCVVGCSLRTSYREDSAVAFSGAVGSSLRLHVPWIKLRANAMHVLVNLTNLYDHPVVIGRRGCTFVYGGETGRIKRGLPMWRMKPGYAREAIVYLVFKEELEHGSTVRMEISNGTVDGTALPPVTLELEVSEPAPPIPKDD
jgi:hypothetical protein